MTVNARKIRRISSAVLSPGSSKYCRDCVGLRDLGRREAIRLIHQMPPHFPDQIMQLTPGGAGADVAAGIQKIDQLCHGFTHNTVHNPFFQCAHGTVV